MYVFQQIRTRSPWKSFSNAANGDCWQKAKLLMVVHVRLQGNEEVSSRPSTVNSLPGAIPYLPLYTNSLSSRSLLFLLFLLWRLSINLDPTAVSSPVKATAAIVLSVGRRKLDRIRWLGGTLVNWLGGRQQLFQFWTRTITKAVGIVLLHLVSCRFLLGSMVEPLVFSSAQVRMSFRRR